jgi:hypothetical protein
MILGYLRYLIYGNTTFSPILCNLPRTGALAIVMKSVIAFHVLTAYPILMNVVNVEVRRGGSELVQSVSPLTSPSVP